MEVLSILSNHTLFLSILIGILLINFGCIIFLVIKEKKEDKEEIEEILSEIEEQESSEKNIDKKEEIKEKEQDTKLEENKREVEEMLMKMQKDLEATPEDVVTNFENEQEENSIISYQELLKSVNEKKENEPKVTSVKIELEEYDNEDTLELEPVVDHTKKFKSTDFISPIFGKQDTEIKYPTVPKLKEKKESFNFEYKESLFNSDIGSKEKLIDTKRLDNEIKKNDEFLKALKEFRKNLD